MSRGILEYAVTLGLWYKVPGAGVSGDSDSGGYGDLMILCTRAHSIKNCMVLGEHYWGGGHPQRTLLQMCLVCNHMSDMLLFTWSYAIVQGKESRVITQAEEARMRTGYNYKERINSLLTDRSWG